MLLCQRASRASYTTVAQEVFDVSGGGHGHCLFTLAIAAGVAFGSRRASNHAAVLSSAKWARPRHAAELIHSFIRIKRRFPQERLREPNRNMSSTKITTETIRDMKRRGEKIAALTRMITSD